MSSRETSIQFFKSIVGRGEKVPREPFNNALHNLYAEVNQGFTEKEIETLVTALITLKLGVLRFKQLIQTLVPVTSVSEKATKDVLLWIFTHFDTVGLTACIILALKWLTGLLQYGLTEERHLDGYYELLFLILQRPKLEQHVSQLLYMLTKPDDISRWRVTCVLKLHVKNRKQRHTNALLCQFKSYRPEYVPENVPTMNVHFAFKDIAEPLRTCFLAAQVRERAASGRTEAGSETNVFYGDTTRAVKKVGTAKRFKVDLIPAVDYIQFGSSIYRTKESCSITQFKTVESLGCYQLGVDIPCQVMSLLANNVGFQVLAFGDSTLQERFSYVLYHQLYAVLVKRSTVASDEIKASFLMKLVAFEAYIQQGIPVVSRFLAEFLHVWNGYDFQVQIFKLLEWITFSSFDELHAIILEHVHRFYVQSNIEEKCLILSTMRRLLQNLFLEHLRREQGLLPQFMNVTATWDSVSTLKAMTRFVQELCHLGLIIEPDSDILLSESLLFYETVSHLEEDCGLPLWTIMTPSIVYRGLFTRNACTMGRVLNLMLRYKNVDNARLKAVKVRGDFLPQFDMVKMYAADFYNCLWHGKAFSNRREGLIFRTMAKPVISRLGRLVKRDEAFLLHNHFAFVPFILPSETGKKFSISSIIKGEWLEHLGPYIPELPELLQACDGDFFGILEEPAL